MPTKPLRSVVASVESRTKMRRRPVLAKQVEALAKKYAAMETTGEPFGTVVIAEMGQKLKEKGKDIIFCAESIISTRTPDAVIEEMNAARQNPARYAELIAGLRSRCDGTAIRLPGGTPIRAAGCGRAEAARHRFGTFDSLEASIWPRDDVSRVFAPSRE